MRMRSATPHRLTSAVPCSEERDLTPEMEQRIEPMQSDFNQVEMERRF